MQATPSPAIESPCPFFFRARPQQSSRHAKVRDPVGLARRTAGIEPPLLSAPFTHHLRYLPTVAAALLSRRLHYGIRGASRKCNIRPQ